MTDNLSPIDKAKFVAAKRATQYVQSGMKVGLGTGSTAAWLVKCLGEMVRDEGLRIKGVPTSTRTAELARQVGIQVITLDEAKWLDVTIDGADEFDHRLEQFLRVLPTARAVQRLDEPRGAQEKAPLPARQAVV
ncbi:MAG: ribose-5-phosphate isomerase A, partial [Marivivens sp.]